MVTNSTKQKTPSLYPFGARCFLLSAQLFFFISPALLLFSIVHGSSTVAAIKQKFESQQHPVLQAHCPCRLYTARHEETSG